MDEKTCTQCGVSKTLSEFYKQKGGKFGVKAWCKACVIEYDKQHVDANRPARNEYVNAYNKRKRAIK